MNRSRRLALRAFVVFMIAAPLSLVMTIVLLPLWSWIESSTGIESVGHSGPAEWCFVAVFLMLASVALAVFTRDRRYP
ncbi:MAG TPA: hypothetical protein VJM31_11385 [Vicinamibacterales bacterium]|nr:hypothetical protein [Vicinamibacterales bacterium]